MRFKKIAAMVVAVLSCFAFFAGCVDEEDDFMGGDIVDKADLLVWTVDPLVGDYKKVLNLDPTNVNAKMTKDIISKFEKDNDIKVVLKNKGWGVDLNKELTLAIGGNTMPDITVGEQFVKSYVVNNHFAPLDFDETLKNDILPQLTGLGTGTDGKLYAAPVWAGSFALIINQDVLKNAKILDANGAVNAAWQAENPTLNPLEPKTWEELLAICKLLNAKSQGGMLLSATKKGGSWRALPFMRTAGGDFVNAKGEIYIENAENEKAFTMMRELVKTSPSGAIDLQDEMDIWKSYLLKDKAAYTIDSVDPLVAADNQGLSAKLRTAPLPTFETDGKNTNVAIGCGYYSIYEKTNKMDVAQKFIKYLMSKEVQIKIMETNLRIPTMRSTLNSTEVKNSDVYATLGDYISAYSDPECVFDGGLPSILTYPADVWAQFDTFSSDLLTTKKGVYADLKTILQTVQTQMRNKQLGK